MNKSKGSPVVVGDERPKDGFRAAFVMPDRGGEREQLLDDADDDAGDGAATVAFQVELCLQGGVHRLDDLPEGLQEASPGP